MESSLSKRLGIAALGLGVAAAGVGVGMLVERSAVGRSRFDPERDEPLGMLRGRRVTVMADDGTALIAEVDEADDEFDDGLTVIFTHGFSLNMDCWHYQQRDLRGKVRMVFWDQRSHGRSGRGSPETHNVDQLGRDLMRIIEDCAPTGPLILAGHSMGGMTIMSLAEDHPEWFGDRVRGVAFFATSSGQMDTVNLGLPAPAAGFVHSHAAELAAIAKANRDVIELGRHHINDLTYALTHTYSFGSNYSQNRTQFVSDMVAGTPIDVIADFAPHLSAHDKKEALAALQSVETLVMVGDRDLVTPHHHSVEIVRHIPGAELVIVQATGHMIIIERYHDVNRNLLELIETVRRNIAA